MNSHETQSEDTLFEALFYTFIGKYMHSNTTLVALNIRIISRRLVKKPFNYGLRVHVCNTLMVCLVGHRGILNNRLKVTVVRIAVIDTCCTSI